MKKILFAILGFAVILLFTNCGSDSNKISKVIKIGATPVPHAEILQEVKPELREQGIALEIIEYNDYEQPNYALLEKDLDANFCQHEPMLEDIIKKHKEMKFKNAGGVHIEPLGIYSRKIKHLDELADNAKIIIPNDTTNRGRALLLLQKAGLLKLKEGANYYSTIQDIAENPKNLIIEEVEVNKLTQILKSVDAAIINTNFALTARLNPVSDALFIEDKTSPYVNIIVVREGDENNSEIQALVKAIRTEKIRKFIENKYKGAIVPVF